MSISPFYFGRGSNLGSVSAATARTFKELVDRYLNIAVPLICTREQYDKMTKDEKAAAKRVNYLVPAAFRTSPSRRVTEQAEHCNLLHIDLDKDPEGNYPASAFATSPRALHQALHPWSFAAYSTASSTPEGPRMRILVHAEQIPIAKYAQAVRTIFHLLGVRHVTTESTVPIQPMYLPSLFAGDDPITTHPLVAFNTQGMPFVVGDIKEVQSSEFSKPVRSMGLEAMDFLRPQMPEITLEIAQSALDALDPDMAYPDWLQTAAAMRHQFSPQQEDEAYQLFDAWSAKGTKYTGSDDTLAKWKSLRPSPEGRMPVTMRTMIRRATNVGWSCDEVKELCFNGLRTWMEAGARTPTSLLAEGVGKIAATPLLTKVEENALLNELMRQAKRRFGTHVTLAALVRDLRQMKAQMHKQREDEDTGDKTPTWAKGLVHVSRYNVVMRHSTGEEFEPESCNAHFGRHLLPTETQLRESSLPPTTANLSKPIVPPFQYLLNHLQIPTIYDLDYDPSSPDDLFTVSDGVALLNTYVQCHPIPDETTSRFAGNAIVRHLERIIAEPAYVRIILDYMAFLVQHPGQKVRWMILLQGAQGCGKSVIADVMRIVLGGRHVKIIDSNTIHSTYNEWAYNATFVAIEEIRVTGTNRHEIMNNLKPLVTNTRIRISQKFKDTREITNRLNLMAFTNYRDAIVVDETDRRYCVIQCALQTKQQVLALGPEYFNELYSLIETNGPGLRHFFENWHISDTFEPNGHAPQTRYMTELVANCASETVAAMRMIIKDGDSPWVQHDMLSSHHLLQMLTLQPGIDRVTNQQLGKMLREEHYQNRDRHMVEGERVFIWTKLHEFPDTLDPRTELAYRVRQATDPALSLL